MNKILCEDMETILCEPYPWGRLRGSTVLITGAAGMLPAYFVHTLLCLNTKMKLGVTVLALVRSAARAKNVFSEYLARTDFSLLVQDVAAPVQYAGGIDYIIHGASQASPKYYQADPVGTLNANVLGTHALLSLAYQKKVKCFFFLSTGDVYGIPPGPAPLGENDYGFIDILNVRSCYNESKRLAETMCVCWWRQYRIPVKIARITHTYGPGVRMDDGRVFADFMANLVRGENIVMYSEGTATRSFCYITDCLRAMYLILFSGETGTAYNIANTREYYSIRQLAELMVSLFPEKNLCVEKRARGETPYIPSPLAQVRWNTAKLEALGWAPKISARQGFLRAVQYMQDTGAAG